MELKRRIKAWLTPFYTCQKLVCTQDQGLGYLQALNGVINPTSNGQNVRTPRIGMDTRLLQSKELGRDLRVLSGLCASRSGAFHTSLTAKLVAVSLNWNSTTCVVYGTNGAWLPNR